MAGSSPTRRGASRRGTLGEAPESSLPALQCRFKCPPGDRIDLGRQLRKLGPISVKRSAWQMSGSCNHAFSS